MHGFLTGPSQWLKNLDALSEVCQPVVVDLWGHGQSPAPEQAEPYLPMGYVQAFEAIRASAPMPGSCAGIPLVRVSRFATR